VSILDVTHHVLDLVTRIQLPSNSAFGGEFPIISIMCATDDVDFICEALELFRDEEWVALSEVMEMCLSDVTYPHARTVWPYNSPQVAIDRCRTAATPADELCGYARTDIIKSVRLHKATFPFIHTHPCSMGEDTVYPIYRENSADHAPPSQGAVLPFLMPTLAIGSILLLAKKKIYEETI
jgi:hypothetical protein